MSRIKFILPIAVLGAIFVLSCSNADEAIQHAQCTATQGEWDADAKKCVMCPTGTTKQPDGQCVASTSTLVREDGTIIIICPARTTLNESRTACVADIIAVDPNAATGKYYCDYGKLDPSNKYTRRLR